MGLEKILADLDRHAGLFDLSTDLGSDLLTVATDGVKASFSAQSTADGSPWPALSTRYAAHKERFWPGRPMGVREGVMVEGLDGVQELAPEAATYTFGTSDVQRQEAEWFTEGDPIQNRPPRPFVGLTEDAKIQTREVCTRYLQDNV